jgi:hypothetical protein
VRFWTREIAGWLLVALGLWIFFTCYPLLANHHPVEAGQWMFVGFVVFRGGIHLLKVAVAARVCMQAVDEIGGQRTAPVSVRSLRPPPRTLPREPSRI